MNPHHTIPSGKRRARGLGASSIIAVLAIGAPGSGDIFIAFSTAYRTIGYSRFSASRANPAPESAG